VKEKYKEEEDFYNDLLHCPHVIYGQLLSPWLNELLENDKENKERLHDVFDFLEELATSGQKLIVEVVHVTVLENLGDEPKLLMKSFAYMGKKTRELSDAIEEFLGRKIRTEDKK
jgi:hypothetical protein